MTFGIHEKVNLNFGLKKAIATIKVGLRKWYDLQFPRYAGHYFSTENYTRIYVKNVTASVKEAFIPFFQSGNTSFNGFKKMLQLQNKILIVGKNQDNPYGGYIGGQGWESALRKMMDRLGADLPLDERAKLIEEERKNVVEAAGKFRDVDIEIHMRDLVSNFHLWPVIVRFAEKEIDLRGIPTEARPKNDLKDGSDYRPHLYPGYESIESYLKTMHESYLKILSCRGCTRIQLIDMIGEYYQIGINAHLFYRGNQSLLMAQVNSLFLAMGLNGIKHASLHPLNLRFDVAALTMKPEAFKQFFRQEVMSHYL